MVAVVATAAATACGTSQEPPNGREEMPAVAQTTTAETTTVEEAETASGYGVELTVPATWQARVYLAQEVTPILQAANFPLPPPSTSDLPADPPLESFGDGGIYIALFDVGDVSHGGVPVPSPFPWRDATLPLAVEEAHFGTPEGLKPPPKGPSLARRYLVIGERAYVLRVAFATKNRQMLVAEANAVLSTLSLSGWRPAECPPNWPGPWTACPEADWVRQVAERAGYRVVGETGSALVAEGGGRSFYIWATDEKEEAVRRQTPVLGTVAGVRVYGDKSLRRSWAAQGFMFWLQAGPYDDSRLPSLAEMALLVRTSLELPPP